MNEKRHGGPAPVPPGNRPHASAAPETGADEAAQGDAGNEAGFQNQDPKRRLGGYETAGEHSRQQPGMLNDGDHHSK